jgi:hypothetical protein
MDYFAHAPQTRVVLERLAREAPTTLACMHGSAWTGDGSRLLRDLAAVLERSLHADVSLEKQKPSSQPVLAVAS